LPFSDGSRLGKTKLVLGPANFEPFHSSQQHTSPLRLTMADPTRSNPPSFDVHTNPYRAQRQWPPDFTTMDPKHQFRLERRYRRRSARAYDRPRWTKGVKIAQRASILFVLGYGALAMDWGDMKTPFDGFRDWLRDSAKGVWQGGKTQLPSREMIRRDGMEGGQGKN
jgi:hypothetical protein